MKVKSVLLRVSALLLLIFLSYGSYQLWCIYDNYAQEAAMHSQVEPFRPVLQASVSSENSASLAAGSGTAANDGMGDNGSADSASITVNQSIADLQARYSDAGGWLRVPNTRIDYPFAQAADNEYYLHNDLEQNRSSAGTLFIDYRNSNNFSDFNTIIFGHNMKNGSMFGTLRNFNDQEFFDVNRVGMIFLKNRSLDIEFFAFAVIRPDDGIVYNPLLETEEERAEFLEHLEVLARYYRDIGVTSDDRLVTLSTCNYEFEDARMVLIGRLV